MAKQSLLPLRLYLLWSLGVFATKLGLAIAASQRTLLVVSLMVLAIVLSSIVSRSIVVLSAQELALNAPPAALVAQTIQSSPSVTTPIHQVTLQRPEANILWEFYKQELSEHERNRDVLSNLIVLASALGLEKDVHVYQRSLFLTDPLFSCTFTTDSFDRLLIECPTKTL